LGNIKTQQAVQGLLEILQREEEAYLLSTLKALHHTGSRQAIPFLQSLLKKTWGTKADLAKNSG
jgi:HEAT repeat protein